MTQETKPNTKTIDGIEYQIVESVNDLPQDMRAVIDKLSNANQAAESADTVKAHLVAEYVGLTRKHKVRLTQTRLADLTGVKQTYVSQITGALKRCADKHGGDFDKAVSALKESKSINTFKDAHKKPKDGNAGGNRAETQKGLALDSFDAIRTALVMVRSQVRQQMAGWSTAQRSEIADLSLEIMDDLEDANKQGERKQQAAKQPHKQAANG